MNYLCRSCCGQLNINFCGLAENKVGRKSCGRCNGNDDWELHIIDEIPESAPRSQACSVTVDAQQIDSAIDQLVESAWAKKSVRHFPRWISVKDRLPEDGGYVLVSDGDDVYMGFKDDSWGSHFMNVESGSMMSFGDITHWQPMPAPPVTAK